MQALLARLRALWAAQSLTRRVLLGMLVLLLATIVVTSSGVLTTGPEIVLDSNLDPSDTAAYSAKLKAANIVHTVDPTATRISVPQDQLAKARTTLAAGGVSVKSKGYEIFDEGGLTTPPFVQSINYMRALQGELARTIMQVDSVQMARVHIARPEPTPFIREQKAVTASVILKLKSGQLLNKQQSAGIVALIARSVEGLRPENVTLLDTNGRQLSDNRAPEEAAATNAQMEFRKELEDYLSQKALALLSAHLGNGRAIVKVDADIDFKRMKEKSRQFTQPGVVASERTRTSKSTGGSSARGAAGTASNITRAGGSAAGGGGNSNDEAAATDYLVSTTEREMEDKMASVNRLSIAAFVDLAPAEGETRKIISVTEAQDIIKQAVGFKTGRDEITVKDAPIGGSTTPTETTEATTSLLDQTAAIMTLVRNGALALAALSMLGLLGLIVLQRRRDAKAALAASAAATAAAAAPAVPPPPTPEELERQAEEQRRKELEEFIEFARRDPDAVAQLILNMLGGTA